MPPPVPITEPGWWTQKSGVNRVWSIVRPKDLKLPSSTSTALIVTLAGDARVVAPEKLFRLVRVIVDAFDDPTGMFMVLGFVAMLKSPATVTVTVEV